MMGHRGKIISGDEMDCFTSYTAVQFRETAGRARRVKRGYNKRQRKEAKVMAYAEVVWVGQQCYPPMAEDTGTYDIPNGW